MESFFSGETLKYLYLLNDPESEVDLGKVCFILFDRLFGLFVFLTSCFILNWKHVFNTEAHPLRIFTYLEDKEK